MQKYQDDVKDPAGNGISGASITVKTYPLGVPATLYDEDGVSVIDNPVTSDSVGRYFFKAANGTYSLTVSGTNIISYTKTDVQLFDPDEFEILQDIVAAAEIAASQAAADVINDSLEALYRIGTVAAVDFTNSANYQRLISTISNPDTRYDVSVVAGSYLTDLRQAATQFIGARLQNITRQGGRVYRCQGVFDGAGVGVTTNSGIALGFDPGVATGANVVLDAAGACWCWRQNSTITAYNFASGGGNSDAAYAFTLTSGTIPSFVAGDVLMLELQENNNTIGGTLRGYKNYALQFTGTVLAIPAGKMVSLMRGIGGGGAYPLALRMTFSSLAASDPVQAPLVTNINLGPTIYDTQISTPGLSQSAALSPVRDASAFLARTAPTGFSWLPITPQIVSQPGDVSMNMTLEQAMFNVYPSMRFADVAYVETTGNNTTAVVNSTTLPYLTIDAAMQSSAKIILVGNGSFAPIDYRFTQSAAGVMKLVMARNRGLTTIKTPGVDLSALTWTLHSGSIYKTTVTAAVGNANWLAYAPHRVRLTDSTDAFGFPSRLRKYDTPTNDAAGVASALASLGGAGLGWVWDGQTANKVLYVALSGANVNTDRARLQALSYDVNTNDRCFLYGANVTFSGIYFDGTCFVAQEYNNAGTYIPSSVWASSCWMINGSNYGAQGDSNTKTYLDNCRIHAPTADGINTDSTRSGSGATAYGMASGCYITACGDVDTFGTSISQNRQAISSHAGYFAGFGSLFEKNWGQEVADTSTGSVNSSWYVGCIARNGDTRLSSNTGFGFYGATRTVWLDTCAVLAEGTQSLYNEGGSSSKIYNCTFDVTPTFSAPSVAPVAYTPSTP